MKKKTLKRSNPLFITEYKNRILRFHKEGKLYMAFETWIVYRNGGGHGNIIKMTNATGMDKEYYDKKMRSIGHRYTQFKKKK